MIDFALSFAIKNAQQMLHQVAETTMRPISREYDEREHQRPTEWLNMIWSASKGLVSFGGDKRKNADGNSKPCERMLRTTLMIEELSWGDAGLYPSIPNAGRGGAAVSAAGTPEQQERFLTRFRDGEPKWGAMAITESHCGSDSAAITSTAVRDGDQWVLNGTKIFCTSGLMAAEKSEGFVVVWATIDKAAGRAGIKAFVVDHHTPGLTITKVEDKLDIRASDTATLAFEDCRIPFDNILGTPEAEQSTEGFKGAMTTFDATRRVAASAIGIGRAAVDYVRNVLVAEDITIRHDAPPSKLSALARDFMDMEANLHAARLLTLRASWIIDQGMRNSLEASMAKAKAGLAATQVTQMAVELLGPLGYSRKILLENGCATPK